MDIADIKNEEKIVREPMIVKVDAKATHSGWGKGIRSEWSHWMIISNNMINPAESIPDPMIRPLSSVKTV